MGATDGFDQDNPNITIKGMYRNIRNMQEFLEALKTQKSTLESPTYGGYHSHLLDPESGMCHVIIRIRRKAWNAYIWADNSRLIDREQGAITRHCDPFDPD